MLHIYRITVDYSSLPDNLKDLEDLDDIKKLTDKMAKTLAEQSMKLQKIHAPNFKVNSLILVKIYILYFIYILIFNMSHL